MLSNAVYIQGHTFLSMKQHKSLGKKTQPNKQLSTERNQVLEQRNCQEKKVLKVAQAQTARGPLQ